MDRDVILALLKELKETIAVTTNVEFLISAVVNQVISLGKKKEKEKRNEEMNIQITS